MVTSAYVFGNHAWMPLLGLQPSKNCTFYCRTSVVCQSYFETERALDWKVSYWTMANS
jgi:hypothetical protein